MATGDELGKMNAELEFILFKSKANKRIKKLEELILSMPYKGEKSFKSHKVALTISLERLKMAIDDLSDVDFYEGKKKTI